MRSPIGSRSIVCALIPHFECEEWLSGTLESLLHQTRPPDAIVVIDDASERAPSDIVERHPEVTLFAASDNGGPYRLIQTVIDETRFDAYLFQDADDWSAPDRLEMLLATAEASGAELVGSHEVRVLVDQGDLVPVRYPLDVNAALAEKPTAFPLLHPTSLVGRDLVQRIGGFARGMRFSGDADFLRRAAHAARVVNADHFGYFRRKRQGSLTTAPDTALHSPARLAVQRDLAERAEANARRVSAGEEPDLRPYATAPPATLTHVTGPQLDRRPRRRRHVAPAAPTDPKAGARPVFVVGAPGAGHQALIWAFGHHPAFDVAFDARWLARTAMDLEARDAEDAAPTPPAFLARMAEALVPLVSPRQMRWIAGGAELTPAAVALARLFPESVFLHLVRDLEGTVSALAGSPTDGGSYLTPEGGARRWLSAVSSGLELEAALGPERVLRVDRDRLFADPETVLRRCLAFANEAFQPECLRPFGAAPAILRQGRAPLPPAMVAAADRLAAALSRPQPADPHPEIAERLLEAVRRRAARPGPSLVEKVRSVVDEVVRPGAIVAVASRGDPRLVELTEAIGWHFPQVSDGAYAGHHPADSDEAIGHLEDLRSRGAEYLVIPAAMHWWLTFYEGLRAHLNDHYQVAAFTEDSCTVYRLQQPDRSAPIRLVMGPGAPVPGGTR